MVSIKKYLPLCLLLIAFALAWQPALLNGFVYWDDYFQITTNFFVKNLALTNLLHLFTPVLNPLGMYQPLTTLIFGLEYKLFGQSAIGFHLFNLLWHLFNVYLVYLLVKKISGIKTAYLTAFFWAILPTNAEAVNWLSSSSTLLSASFGLTALLYYFNYLQEFKRWQIILVYLFFILALLSKVSLVILPILMLCLDWLINKKITVHNFYQKLFFWLFSALLGVIALIIRQISHLPDATLPNYNILDKIVLIFYSLGAHLTKVFVPINLYYPYGYPAKFYNWLSWEIYAYAFLGILIIALIKIIKNREYRFWLIWFIVCLLPMIKFNNFSTPFLADRYLYLASLGPLVIAFSYLQTLPKKYYRLISLGLINLAIIFIFITREQSSVWRNDLTIWEYSLKNNPKSSFTLGMLGQVYLNAGLTTEAKNYFAEAVAINSQDKVLNNNLGLVCLELQNLPCALKALTIATQENTDSADPWRLLAKTELQANLYQAGLSSINQTIILDSQNGENYYLKALINLKLNQPKEACTNLAKAVNLGYTDTKELMQQICPSKLKTP